MKDIIRALRSLDHDDILGGFCLGVFFIALMFSPLFVG